ncbi:MAG: hypothetical protein AB8H12_18305 [Lewinella sp.]
MNTQETHMFSTPPHSQVYPTPIFGRHLWLILLLLFSFSCQEREPAEELEAVNNVTARDNGNRGNAADIEVNFTQRSNTSTIGLYRIFILKSVEVSTQDLPFLQSLSGVHYTEVAPEDIFPLQGKFLPEQMVDTDGDQIRTGISYRAAVVAIPANSDEWSPSLAFSEDLVLTQNNLVRPYSGRLDTGVGSLTINDQGMLAMCSYDILADLQGGAGEEQSPIYIFNLNSVPSSSSPDQTFSFLGGSAIDSQGNLYVANTSQGEILKISPDNTIDTLQHTGTNLIKPDGIFINAEDHIFVADRSNGAVIRITPDGTSTRLTTVESGIRGITGDEAGNLYVTVNREAGKVMKIAPDGFITTFAQIPTFVPSDYQLPFIMWVGYLTYHQGELYVAGTSTHRIYKVDGNGTVTVFAGSGHRLRPSGDALTANFNRPMGLAFSPDGTRLFVSGCMDTAPSHVQASKPARIYQIEIN